MPDTSTTPDVEHRRWGAQRGYKQTPEHIAKKARWGPSHHAWKGDLVDEDSGRARARRLFSNPKPCSRCGILRSERHHKDGNTLNNSSENVESLCRRCHMTADGRLGKFRSRNGYKTLCPKGHPYSGENLVLIPNNKGRRCRECERERSRRRFLERSNGR